MRSLSSQSNYAVITFAALYVSMFFFRQDGGRDTTLRVSANGGRRAVSELAAAGITPTTKFVAQRARRSAVYHGVRLPPCAWGSGFQLGDKSCHKKCEGQRVDEAELRCWHGEGPRHHGGARRQDGRRRPGNRHRREKVAIMQEDNTPREVTTQPHSSHFGAATVRVRGALSASQWRSSTRPS